MILYDPVRPSGASMRKLHLAAWRSGALFGMSAAGERNAKVKRLEKEQK